MMPERFPARLTVVGAGAWGTVIAILLARNGHQVTLLARSAEHAEELRRARENRRRLPGTALPPEIAVGAPEDAPGDAEAVFVAVPSQALAEVARRLPPAPLLVSCSKGFIPPGPRRPSEVLAAARPEAVVAVLSGPNLAAEIAAGSPAAAVVASDAAPAAARVQGWLQQRSFRVYTSDDPTGVEVGGAVKNVIALAAGLSDGLELGDNAKASIMTRGLAEAVRLGSRLGARTETLYGLSGLGDMVATCSSRSSRNHLAGERIARGERLADLQRDGLTAEGIPTVDVIHDYASRHRLSLPIAREVYQVVYERKPPEAAIFDLMTRAGKAEW